MKISTLLCFAFLGLFTCPLVAQEKASKDDQLKWLYNEGKYDAIIEGFSDDAQQLSVPSLYYLVFANITKENYVTSLVLIDLALKKDPTSADSYHVKGDILASLKRFNESITAYQKAVELAPENFNHTEALGDMYGQTKAYKEGITLFKNALASIEPATEAYLTAYYNLGLFESLLGNYKAAISYFELLLEQNPKDYFTQSKLIQAYYSLGDYKKAEPLKRSLYKAHADSLLVDTSLEDMFCIEQFDLNGNKVLAFERYEDGHSRNIYNKHCFYLLKPDGELNLRVQTEYSPFAVDGRVLYFLCATFSESTRSNSGITFGENYDYKKVKAEVIKYMKRLSKNR